MDLLTFPGSVPVQREIGRAEKPIHDLQYTKSTPDELVDLAIQSNITRINKCGPVGGDEAFYIADLGQVTRQHQRWTRCFPDIRPYYGTVPV